VELFKSTLGAILPLFGLVLIGYLGKKARVLHATDAQVLSRFVVDIALPAFIVDAFVTHHLRAAYFKLPVTLWVASAIAFGATLMIGKLTRATPKTIGAMILLSCFGNTGYMGYPITTALLPKLLPATVLCDQLGMSLLLYPGAVMLGSIYGRTEEQSLRDAIGKFARSPIFIALVVGIAAALAPSLHAPIPGSPLVASYFFAHSLLRGILAVLHTTALATIPVVLIAIGLMLRPSTLKQHWKEVSYIGLLKLIVSPVVGWAVGRYALGFAGPLLTICVLECGVPPSASATVFAGQYEMDGSLAIAAFFALTIASAVTLPIAVTLLR